MKDRILKAVHRAKELENRVLTEKDLRGLTVKEKEYIRNNEYRVYSTLENGEKIYLFIAKQGNGRKSLYAITKMQSVNPNGHDISKDSYNFECWLTFWDKGFCKFYYEKRISRLSEVSNVLIFA